MRFLKRIVSKAFEKSAKIIIVIPIGFFAFVISSRMACIIVIFTECDQVLYRSGHGPGEGGQSCSS